MTPDQRRLKKRTGELVTALHGSEAAAEDLGKGKSTVHRWTDVNEETHFINVADLMVLEGIAGDPMVTRLLCRFAGGVFIKLPKPIEDPAELATMALELAKELGELSAAIAIGLADGVLSRAEAGVALGELEDLERVGARLRAALEQVLQEGKA